MAKEKLKLNIVAFLLGISRGEKETPQFKIYGLAFNFFGQKKKNQNPPTQTGLFLFVWLVFLHLKIQMFLIGNLKIFSVNRIVGHKNFLFVT